MRLQQLSGNRAVQQLMLQRQHAESEEASGKKSARLAAVATIKLSRGGDVKGECRLPGHEGKIELLSIQMGTPSAAPEGPPSADLAIRVQKHFDSASPVLARAVLEGDAIKSAKFEFVRPGGGGKWVTSAAFDFTDGFPTAYQAGSGAEPIESISMEFPKK